MSTVQDYLTSGQYATDMNTIKGLVDSVESEVTTLYVNSGNSFTKGFSQLVGKSVFTDLLAKCDDIKAYCDQVKTAGAAVVTDLAGTP